MTTPLNKKKKFSKNARLLCGFAVIFGPNNGTPPLPLPGTQECLRCGFAHIQYRMLEAPPLPPSRTGNVPTQYTERHETVVIAIY